MQKYECLIYMSGFWHDQQRSNCVPGAQISFRDLSSYLSKKNNTETGVSH